MGIGLSFDESSDDKELAAIEFKGKDDRVEFKTNSNYGSTGWYDLETRLVGFETMDGMNSDLSLYSIR